MYLCFNLVSWSLKKQQVIVLYSTEAEYRALPHIAAEICWLQNLSQKLYFYIDYLIIWSDNRGAIALAVNPVLHAYIDCIEIDPFCSR